MSIIFLIYSGNFQKYEMVAVNDAFRSLFLYAAINNMTEMAVQLWKYGKSSLMKALVGKLIFRKMYLRALKNPRVTVDIKRNLRDNES